MSTWDPAARRLHIHPMENLTWVRKDGPCSFTFEGGICSPKSSCRQDQIFGEEILHFYQMIPERRKTMLPYLFCEARIGAVDQWFWLIKFCLILKALGSFYVLFQFLFIFNFLLFQQIYIAHIYFILEVSIVCTFIKTYL